MRYSIVLTVGVAGAAGLGFWAGTAWGKGRAPQVTAGTMRSGAPGQDPSPPHRLFATALLEIGDADSDDGEESQAERLGWQLCREQLLACRARDEQLREPFPEDAMFEEPEAWEDAVTKAVQECGGGLVELDTVECSHYPCIGGLRRRDTASFKQVGEVEAPRLTQAFRDCEPLRNALGGDVPEDAIDLFPFRRRCEDGSYEEFWILMALDPAGEAWEFYERDHNDDLHVQSIMRWMYRRGEDLATQWQCESDRS